MATTATPANSAAPTDPIAPMLAKAISEVPEQDSVAGGLLYEPKWDGFRAIVYFDGDEIELGSRGGKSLTRYFPELVAALKSQFSQPCIVDGEIVVRTGTAGNERLDWEALSQRVHPAASRIALLSVETPASLVAFDLLSLGDESLMERPFSDRRALLEDFLADRKAPLHLTQTTTDAALARSWFSDFEGAGLDGVVAKPLAAPYAPGKRTLLKIKHKRTADAVVLGYRIHKSGQGVGSLLLGLYGADGELINVGGVSAFSDARRLELVEEFAPLVVRDDAGEAVTGERERNRFSASKDMSFVQLRPTRVVEVVYDQMEGSRFRHSAQFLRWRDDRDAASCTFDQLEIPVAYDLNDVLV